MPGKINDEEERDAIESQARESQKTGLRARLEAASNKGKEDEEAMRLWRLKKGGGSEGGAERSVGSAQPKDTREEEEAVKKKQEAAAKEKEKEDKRVAGERRTHELDRFYREQYERSR